MKAKICVSILLSITLVSCLSPLEKEVKQYQKKGMTIVEVLPPLLYVYDGRSLFVKNIETHKRDMLIDFEKNYYPTYIHPFLEEGQTSLQTQLVEEEYVDFERKISPSAYNFSVMKDFGILAKGMFNNGTYQFEDELLFLFHNLETCYSIKGFRKDTVLGTPCVSFNATNSLWYYGSYLPAWDSPEFPQGSINEDVFHYWENNEYKLPMNIFEYTTRLYMTAEGKVLTCDDFIFKDIQKKYPLEQIINGYIFHDIDSVMTRAFLGLPVGESVDED